MTPVRTLLAAVAIGAIRVYQWVISPVLPRSCRFAPSCSEYAAEAIGRHGILAGLWLAARRLARCHPWGGDGYDPVPDHPWADHSWADHSWADHSWANHSWANHSRRGEHCAPCTHAAAHGRPHPSH